MANVPLTGNPAVDVQRFGQSIWYDNISRDMIRSGQLQKLIDEFGVLGMTSNPTIFDKAIGESTLYDESISTLLDLDANEIFDTLSVDDIRAAADLLRPIYDRTNTADGYVSLEVSPMLANDTETTLSEAKRLFKLVDRPNVMIKIPGTPAGLPAIEEALFAGVNINVTLLFAVKNYVDVAEAFIRALERRLAAGLPVDKLASVASFFVSRIDSMVDKQLENNIRSAQGRDLDRISSNSALLGKVAIANAKVAYKRFKELFYGDRFNKLRVAGAQVQRPLWASTGTKNPNYPDTLYIDKLIGSDTVNTVPHATLVAFKDHGTVGATLEEDLNTAQDILDKLAEVGIDLDKVTQQLQEDGVDAFIDSFRKLISKVEGKRKTLLSGFMQRQDIVLGIHQAAVDKELKRLRGQMSITRTWQHDATLWKDTPDHIKSINNRLGWLTITNDGRIDRDTLKSLRDEAKQQAWTYAVLLGMGGSSLAPEVLWKTFGQQAGFPALIVLDSTDPDAIQAVESQIDLSKTVFLVSSKSGTTVETLSLQKYFFAKYTADAGSHFIAITDAGSKLEAEAKELKFRHTFLNPEDIGGRYSALSYFGMVPAAVTGLDFERIMDTGTEMQVASSQGVTGNNHPGLWLGTVMAVLTQAGRNKLTLVTSPELDSFGDWIEQLVAESTGKDGKGIIPVTGATIGMPHDYGEDRHFIYLRLDDSEDSPDEAVRALQEAGQPVMTLRLRDKFDIGAEFFRWEFATAVTGMILQINPFDEPNVTESKNNTAALLEIFQQNKKLPSDSPLVTEDGVSLYVSAEMGKLLRKLVSEHNYNSTELVGLLAAYFTISQPEDYFALMAYIPQNAHNTATLETIRRRLRHTFKRAVTLGFGPRFLHSTGQLHKGGPNTGVFLQITTADQNDIKIPDAPYGFSTLKQAQAMGDWQALVGKNRRVLRLHMASLDKGMDKLAEAVEATAAKRK